MLVDVALPLPLPRTFTYEVPAAAAENGAAAGTRVLVPFGRRRLIGWITGRAAEPPSKGRLRQALRVFPEDAPDADLLRVCQWISDYYVAPLGQVLRTALPAVLSQAARPEPPVRTRRVLRLARDLPSLLERDTVFARAPRQRELYELLETAGAGLELQHLTSETGFSRSVINGLIGKRLARLVDEERSRDPFADMPRPPIPDLRPTPAQNRVIAALRAAASGAGDAERPFLLRGVTGSGKTLVYIELLRDVVERQRRGAIVLVPEIALTPQTVARFRAHFGDTIAVLHSALSDGERYDAWRALRAGRKRIAIGARSAIFAPIAELGAIIVDEEHEASYKQSEAPRYHAREVAIMRALEAGAVCVLGSATPSLESWRNAHTRKFRLLELPERVEGWPMPPVEVVDLRRKSESDSESGFRARRSGEDRTPAMPILTPRLETAIADRLTRAEQTILLLNRRGYATFVQCRDCGHVWHCPDCNVSLTYHRARRRLVCHYCHRDEPLPARCSECGAEVIVYRGLGTEQVERAVGEAFPSARIARMDVDTTGGKWSHHEILGRVGRGEVDILLGTQMIAKGLDFPRVTLVGVVNADVGINLPDFRAAERTFQLLTQVAGRAGRGPLGGEVVIQTSLPTNDAVRCAVHHDYAGFAARELERRVNPAYPPNARLVNIIVSGLEEDAVADAVDAAAAWVRAGLRRMKGHEVELLGPAPCAIDRIRGRWRWHFLLRSRHAAALGRVARLFHERYPQRASGGDLRIAIDRDPVALL